MIPDLKIHSVQRDTAQCGVGTDVYSGDVKLLDVYALDIVFDRAGAKVVATSKQSFTYEGPATITTDPSFHDYLERTNRWLYVSPDETVNVRIVAGRGIAGLEVVRLDTGDSVEGITNIALRIESGKHDVTIHRINMAAMEAQT